MPNTMARDKKKAAASPAPEKRGDPISYRPHPKLVRPLQEYREKFRYQPSKAEVIDEALATFLRSEGFDIPDLTDEASD